MTTTGLQRYININLDGTRTYKVVISIYPRVKSQGRIETSEMMEASVEALIEVAGDTLQEDHLDSVITFKFPQTEDIIECFRGEEGIICRKSEFLRS
jgi:RNase P/RNase MRP subunit POP5